MNIPRVAGPIVALVLTGAVLGSCAYAEEVPPDAQPPAAQRPAAPPDVYKAPDHPLDSRINAEKVTQNDPPPLPQRVVLPMPPTFQISTDPKQLPIDPELWKKANDALQKGLDFLRAQQNARGGWMAGAQAAPTDQPDRPSAVSIAVTSLAVKAFAQASPDALKDDHVRKALRLITSAHDSDGAFDNSSMANYVTSAVLSALASIDDKQTHDYIADSIKWLEANQWDQSEGLSARQDWFGGAGYGNGQRPDLSNTQMMLDALYDAGLSPDEPAFQKAIAFISRTQNLKETNKATWAGNDGGFIYSPANGGESMGSEAAGEGRFGEKMAGGETRSLRSYGAMTYAGFKSMLYAGLSPDDVRVRAAFDWIRNHWTFDENPGLGQQGLYYYYHTVARTLLIAQQNEITDAAGAKHNWREELIQALLKRQQDDGSWINKDKNRWMEGEPPLVTAYAVLALEEALKPVSKP